MFFIALSLCFQIDAPNEGIEGVRNSVALLYGCLRGKKDAVNSEGKINICEGSAHSAG